MVLSPLQREKLKTSDLRVLWDVVKVEPRPPANPKVGLIPLASGSERENFFGFFGANRFVKGL